MENQEQKYYVCHRDIGLTKFETDDDSMISILASADKSQWVEFDWDEAQEARSFTGWKIQKAFELDDEF